MTVDFPPEATRPEGNGCTFGRCSELLARILPSTPVPQAQREVKRFSDEGKLVEFASGRLCLKDSWAFSKQKGNSEEEPWDIGKKGLVFSALGVNIWATK